MCGVNFGMNFILNSEFFMSLHLSKKKKSLDSPRVGSKPSGKVLQIYGCPDDSCSESLPSLKALVTPLRVPEPSSHIIACQFLDCLQWFWVWGTSGTCWVFQDFLEVFLSFPGNLGDLLRTEVRTRNGASPGQKVTHCIPISLFWGPPGLNPEIYQKEWESTSHFSILTSLILHLYTLKGH